MLIFHEGEKKIPRMKIFQKELWIKEGFLYMTSKSIYYVYYIWLTSEHLLVCTSSGIFFIAKRGRELYSGQSLYILAGSQIVTQVGWPLNEKMDWNAY